MPTEADPRTNQFRCNACGRFFNTADDLAQHEAECRAAKTSTEQGRQELDDQDERTHPRNDAGKGDMPAKRPPRMKDAGKAAEERPVPSQAEGEDY
jgi:hypothetical protein